MKLERVKGGWAAVGDGWAVFGATEDEAAERFAEAEHKHEEIDERDLPPVLEAQPAESPGYRSALEAADSESWDGPGVDAEAMIEAANERRRGCESSQSSGSPG